jgi:hypothetical protein
MPSPHHHHHLTNACIPGSWKTCPEEKQLFVVDLQLLHNITFDFVLPVSLGVYTCCKILY